MDKLRFIEAAAACVSNGHRLLYDAEWLSVAEQAGTCFALARIAQEEFAKVFLLFLVSRDAVAWNSLIFRATRDHTCKQLLGLVMCYIMPDFDEGLKRDQEWLSENEERKGLFAAYKSSADPTERDRIWTRIQEISEQEDCLPRSVVDAINILRHEKIGRWQSSSWVWADAPVYDEIAKSLGDGKLDREKQVARTPAQIKSEDATAAMETAKRLGTLLEGLLSGSAGGSFEYEKVESAIKIVFREFSRADEQTQGET